MAEKGVWRKLIIHKAVMAIFQITQKARATCNKKHTMLSQAWIEFFTSTSLSCFLITL